MNKYVYTIFSTLVMALFIGLQAIIGSEQGIDFIVKSVRAEKTMKDSIPYKDGYRRVTLYSGGQSGGALDFPFQMIVEKVTVAFAGKDPATNMSNVFVTAYVGARGTPVIREQVISLTPGFETVYLPLDPMQTWAELVTWQFYGNTSPADVFYLHIDGWQR